METLIFSLYSHATLTGLKSKKNSIKIGLTNMRISQLLLHEFSKQSFLIEGSPIYTIIYLAASEFKFKTSNDIDSVVSIEMLDKNIDPICHEVVSKFRIHGPCGIARSSTTLGENGFVYYRWHEFCDNFVFKNRIMLFNDYVAPYNKELLMRHNAHINVEIYCQLMLIKYLLKYKLFGKIFNSQLIQDILQLKGCKFIFLFNKNFVFSETGLFNLLRRSGIKKTMLMTWFECNKNFSHAQDLYYSEFPYKYKEWVVRSKGLSLGRITYVHPTAGKPFFRLLLNHIKGSTGFADLRTIHIIVYPIFQLACKAYMLLGDDKEWSEAFYEAIAIASSPQLKQVFISIILFCQVVDPLILFN
uniref:Uncharacterized protein n=1 Tax=Salix viminalis TaxID=40686 RepID=A0A6N2ND49_SALVM